MDNFEKRAAFLAERGIPVAPVQPKQKKCTHPGWQNDATTDLSRWESIHQSCNTAAVAKANGKCISDADEDGLYARVERETGKQFPPTLTVKSAHGDGHRYWNQTDRSRALGNRQLNNASGERILDFKQHNSYCVGPGSVHPSGAVYTVVDDSPIADIPDWFCEWIERATRKQPQPQSTPAILDARAGVAKTPSVPEVVTRIMSRDLALVDEKSLQAISQSMGFAHRHQADEKLAIHLVRCSGMDAEEKRRMFSKYKLHQDRSEQYDAKTFETAVAWVAAHKNGKDSSSYTGDGSDWREGFQSFAQLNATPPAMLVAGLVPEGYLTFITGPSFHGKTWLALQLAKSISDGSSFLTFDGPSSPVPVAYHVPEMLGSDMRQRCMTLGIKESENLLFRPMEKGLWTLNDARMLRSAEGRVVVFDTIGYFNPADDTSNYQQALELSNLVRGLLNAGARGCIGLYHPPKYSTTAKPKESGMTLENMLLGSAGYGGMLRSCLGVRNLNADLNDQNVWLYVQGLKNPGLKPFQLQGTPLTMKVPPGESPYLRALLESLEGQEDPRKLKAFEMLAAGASVRTICNQLKVRPASVTKWKADWEAERSFDAPDSDDPDAIEAGRSLQRHHKRQKEVA